MKIYSLLLLSTLATFSGCGKDSELIIAVKQRAINDQFTYEQAFERNYCESSDWSLEKDGHNRDVVKFTCDFVIDNETVSQYIRSRTQWVSPDRHPVGFDSIDWSRKFNRALWKLEDYQSLLKSDVARTVETSTHELKEIYGISSASELDIAIEALRAHRASDMEKLNNVMAVSYANQLLNQIPDELHITKVLRIVLLPNNKDQWYTPEFYAKELESEFSAGEYSIETTDVLEPIKTSELFQALLSRFYNVNYADFQAYVLDECEAERCPLVMPYLSYYFGPTVDEGDNWD